MSDTPETDAAFYVNDRIFDRVDRDQWQDFARKLERERDEAREVASGLAIQEERVNEAQKELSSIHRWIERNHADGFIDSLTYLQNLDRITENWYDRLDRLEIDAGRFERERDEAREQNAKLRDIAERILLNCETLHPNTVKLHRSELDQLKEGAK